MLNNFELLQKWVKPFPLIDIFGFLLTVSFCFFSFQHGDISHTISCSISYLFGHFADFYDFNSQLYVDLNYLPSTYIIFAIWGIPLKLLGILPEPGQAVSHLIPWYKVFTSIFYFASGYLLKLIGEQFGLSKQSSKILMGLWLTTPIAVFSQFIFGQYDILTVFFMLAGIHFYLKGDLLKFTLVTGFSLTFKYFPIFSFVPMLLLKEKNLKKIIFYCSTVFVFLALEILPYIKSPAFRHGVFGFTPSHRILSTVFQVSNWQFSVFFFFWFFICAYAYLKELPKEREQNTWALYLGWISVMLVFALVTWHPQWLIILTPFLVLSAFLHERSAFFYFIDLALMGAMVALCATAFPFNVDQVLWTRGIFGSYNNALTNPATTFAMGQLPGLKGLKIEFSLAIFNAGLLVYGFFNYPSAQFKNWTNLEKISNFFRDQVSYIRVRFYLGMSIWIIPALLSYFITKIKFQ